MSAGYVFGVDMDGGLGLRLGLGLGLGLDCIASRGVGNIVRYTGCRLLVRGDERRWKLSSNLIIAVLSDLAIYEFFLFFWLCLNAMRYAKACRTYLTVVLDNASLVLS